jgi:2-amino-4-hydroxy-6-hydroxymethyldihydropteridine diphosphokinase
VTHRSQPSHLNTHRIFLSLGSNLGDRERSLELAAQLLLQNGVKTEKLSSIYSTEPVDFKDQPWFLNQVVLVETVLAPRDLLVECLGIERSLGRQRIEPKGPRTLDVDILLYDDWVVEEMGLTIPHPRLHLRRFVLIPLIEIEPNLVHPVFHEPVTSLLERCPDPSQVVLVGKVC